MQISKIKILNIWNILFINFNSFYFLTIKMFKKLKINYMIFKKILVIFLYLYIFTIFFKVLFIKKEYFKFDKNFDYINYDKNIITEKMKKYAGWMLLNEKEIFFINGIIRKYKPKKLLEIGVARGGSSILILNAIKDIKNSFLISLDLNKQFYIKRQYKTGYKVKKFFPELTKNWRLFTGEQPHIFLERLNITFEFVFLDTAHISPGEFLNLIEILPFLEENAIILLHDITFHLFRKDKSKKFTATQIFLMSALYGDKLIIKNKNGIENVGAVYLYKNQKEYYLNYFLLLLSYWEYLPSEKHIDEIRTFIKKIL